MTSDGLSHYKQRLWKLCFSHCGGDEWQVDLYRWLYNDAVSSFRVIDYGKIITNIILMWKGLERERL